MNISSEDVFYGGIADLADGELCGGGNGSANYDRVGECKSRPVIVDGAEVGVFCVRKCCVLDELSANDGVLASLIGEGVGLSIMLYGGVSEQGKHTLMEEKYTDPS